MKKRFTKLASVLMALCLTLGLTAVATTAFAEGDAVSEVTYSAKTAVPEAADYVNYWGGVSDLEAKDGDGIFTFAHGSYTVGLEGTNVSVNTLFKLYSKKAVEEGGDGIDGWVTYSLSAAPGGDTDNTFPYYGGSGNGYFLHITNYSGTTAPNCVEVQVVEMKEGKDTGLRTFWLDNAVNTPLTLSFKKVEDGTYTLSFTRNSDNAVLKEETGFAFDESLFINEKGQTFLSHAIYESGDCGGNHWEHRGVAIFTAQVYTIDAQDAVVALEAEEYEFEEGTTYKPAVTVTVDGKELVKDTDYIVDYADNKAVGTAKAVVTFIGEYTGNAKVEKSFTIKEKAPDTTEPGDTGSDTTSDPTTSDPATSEGCFGGVGAGLFAAIALLGLGAVALKKKN